MMVYSKERSPEIIGKRSADLLKNPHFIGFGIFGDIPKEITSLLKENYPEKIIFDGKRIRGIKNF